MSDPIPGCDPNEAYEVVPLDPIRKERDPWGWAEESIPFRSASIG